jgi:acetoin utilization deacetylase AcuC-like enzyme
MASMGLSAGDFADIARRVRGFAPQRGRLALLLEGGYDLEALRLSVGASLAAVLDGDFRPETATVGGPGADAVDAARSVVDEGPLSGR